MERIILTSHGPLAVEEIGRGGIPVLLIHGNSSCRGVFRRQMQSTLAENHHLIAFDLPGHGDSSDALEPARSYTLPGLADAAIELLTNLRVTEVVVFGWSLGGHVGIEMMSRFAGIRGLMIAGAPPIGPHDWAQGFVASSHAGLAGKRDLSKPEIDAFLRAMFGDTAEPSLREAMVRADGRFRKRLFEAARAGEGIDERAMVETSPIPLAVVNGGADPLINLDYVDSVRFANLWEGRCRRLAGLGHAPFWEAPVEFNPLLERFLQDVESGRASAGRL